MESLLAASILSVSDFAFLMIESAFNSASFIIDAAFFSASAIIDRAETPGVEGSSPFRTAKKLQRDFAEAFFVCVQHERVELRIPS